MVRVSDASNYDRVLGTLTKGKLKLEKLQTEGATMRRLQAPSDDPVSAQTVLSIRTELQNAQQFEAACQKAQSFLLDFDQSVEELAEAVIRARDLVLSGSSDASSSDQTRQGMAEEVHQLSLLALSIANRQIGPRYIFAGFDSSKPPVTDEGLYVGDEGEMTVEISHHVALPVNMPGSQVFALPDEWDPSLRLTVFEDLARAEIAFRTGDVATLRETIEPLERMHAHLVTQRAKMGSRMFAVSATLQALQRHQIQAQSLSASLEDADVAKTVVDLTREETLYKTALQASKHLLQPSLLEYLR